MKNSAVIILRFWCGSRCNRQPDSHRNLFIVNNKKSRLYQADGKLSVQILQLICYTQTIDRFKPLLVASIVNDSMDKPEQAAVKSFFETTDTKIPVLIDLREQLMCSKHISNNMLVKYEDMEEYEELEVTIIARITSSVMVKSQKAFYDPLKDFMTLNRVMRRSIEGRTDGLNEIYADKDYRTIEVLAIYQ